MMHSAGCGIGTASDLFAFRSNSNSPSVEHLTHRFLLWKCNLFSPGQTPDRRQKISQSREHAIRRQCRLGQKPSAPSHR